MPHRIVESEDILAKNGNRLHAGMMVMVFIYSVLYTTFNYIRGQYDQLLFVALPMPAVVISYLLYRNGRFVLSKVLLIIITMAIIINICNIESQETFILAFFGPIIVGSLVTLQGPQRRIGYIMAGLSCLVLIYLLLTDFGPHVPLVYTREHLQIERIMNLVGASILVAAQLMFIMHNSRVVQEQLILRSQDLHRSNDELRQTVLTRDKLLSVLSHDLRSPLVVISSGLELIKNSSSNQAVQLSLAEQLNTRTRQTLSLVDDIILWSRNQSHAIEFQPAPHPMAFVRSTVDTYFSLLDQQKGIRLENRIPDSGVLMADKNMLDTVLRNLISNAFKFTPNGGCITVKAETQNGHWEFSVTDTGKGMDAAVLERIRRAESFTTVGTNLEKGHGLGLQLVRDFLKLHDSSFEAESEIGKGTTFRFRIASA